MEKPVLDTYHKALAFNMDKKPYGTIAEIGAGQETSRWLFKVGGAASTIAKAMSAYDMKFSDSIYGTCERYVSRERLEAMLEKEYSLVTERLDEVRGSECTFFAFANTVATFSFSPISVISASVFLNLKEDVRAATFRPSTLARRLSSSSDKPSEKYSLSSSALILTKGNTAMDFSMVCCSVVVATAG